MKTVWKFPLAIGDFAVVTMPKGAKILHVSEQARGEPQMWALVDPEAATEQREFRFAGTGHPIQEQHAGNYVGSFLMHSALVFHIFETERSYFAAEGIL